MKIKKEQREILNIHDMATLTGRSERAIRIAIHRGKSDLPPSQIIACKRVWLRSDVEKWLESLSLIKN